jgi:phytoene dehydrogenase-like protein
MTQQYDAVIIGGGHNGLVTAAYLARAGVKVLVLERRAVLGGASVTEEPWPGYRVSTLAYLCSLLHPRIIRELELERFGFHLYPKDPAFFTAFPDGRHIFFWQDEKETLRQISKFSVRDAAAYPAYEAELERLIDFIEPLLMQPPPNLVGRRLADLAGLARLGFQALNLKDSDLVRFAKIMTQSVGDFLNERFESEQVKVTLATDGVIGTNGGPSTPGTAYILLHHVMGGATGRRGLWGFVRGGMGAIGTALAQSAQTHGAVIRTSAPVHHVLIKEGLAYGVALAGGEEVHGKVIVSNADPKRTFLGLVGAEHLEDDFRQSIENIRIEGCSLKINLALDGLPNFEAFPGTELSPPHKATIHVCPSMDYIDRAWDDAKAGQPSEFPLIECTIPTAYDDSIAPPGKHIMCLFVQYAPYQLKDGHWDQVKEAFADRCLDILAQYAPNIKQIIRHRQVISPVDMEREYGLTGGNIFHGELSLDQLFFLRPVAGWAQYRTPIGNLYLCGSGTHPGGGVMGAPGFNAVRTILKDLKRYRKP